MQHKSHRARHLRQSQTKSEGLLWSILRGKQLCGLKFRRQHPIGPFFADFACTRERLVVEVDGGYHDTVIDADLDREDYLKRHGWQVIRFTDEEVETDAEAVGRAIACKLNLPYVFVPRKADGSGMESVDAPGKRK